MNAHFFNRRLFFRRAVNEAAWIERVPSILERCTLINVCEIGARLAISDVYDLPENFALHLTGNRAILGGCCSAFVSQERTNDCQHRRSVRGVR